MSFEQSINRVLKHEGGYVNHPDDPGGETNMGITKNTALRYKSLWGKWDGNMKTLPLDVAKSIYKVGYWDKVKGDILDEYHPLLADHVFDFYVNAGNRACYDLQHALNILNNQGKLYPDIKEDGDIGPTTLNTLSLYYRARGDEGIKTLIYLLLYLQANHYVKLSTNKSSFESFTYGWINRVNNKLRAYQKILG